jgi:hypothetical protein
MLEKYSGKLWTGIIWLRMGGGGGAAMGYCEHGKELSGSIKGGKFLDKVSNH